MLSFQAILAAAVLGGLVCAAFANQSPSADSHATASRDQAQGQSGIPGRSDGELIQRAQSPIENSASGQAEAPVARSRIVLAVYCALADLLPEMEFHRHNRIQLTTALFAGIALGWAVHFLEPAHSHGHEPADYARKKGESDILFRGRRSRA